MLEVLANYVLFPLGIISAIGLLLVIIFHFIKKKTKKVMLPSIMFLLAEQGKRSFRWFPRFPFNWLFILHFFITLLLVAAVVEPFIWVDSSATKEHAIHILDTSASMQAGSRFADAISDMQKNLAPQNTLILTSPDGRVVLDKATPSQLRSYVKTIKVTDSLSPLADTVIYTQQKDYGDVAYHIYSDFSETKKDEIALEKALLRFSEGVVKSHVLSSGKNKLAFVSSQIKADNITIQIKNFENKAVNATVSFQGNNIQVPLEPKDVSSVSFSIKDITEQTTIRLAPNDQFPVDNSFYVAPVIDEKKSALYISNSPYLFTDLMFDAIPFVSATQYAPPGVVDVKMHDIIFIEEANLDKLLPSTYQDALDRVEAGGVLVFKMSDRLKSLKARDEYPFTKIDKRVQTTLQIVPSTLTTSLTTAATEQVFPIELSDDAKVLVQTQDGEAVIAYKHHGNGVIVYYGIFDQLPLSSFKESYAFPILFQRLFSTVFNLPSRSQLQKETNDFWTGSGFVTTPTNSEKNLPRTISETGFYTYANRIYASNMLSIEESNVEVNEQTKSMISEFKVDSKVESSLALYFVMAALLLFAIESFFLRHRGEL